MLRVPFVALDAMLWHGLGNEVDVGVTRGNRSGKYKMNSYMFLHVSYICVHTFL